MERLTTQQRNDRRRISQALQEGRFVIEFDNPSVVERCRGFQGGEFLRVRTTAANTLDFRTCTVHVLEWDFEFSAESREWNAPPSMNGGVVAKWLKSLKTALSTFYSVDADLANLRPFFRDANGEMLPSYIRGSSDSPLCAADYKLREAIRAAIRRDDYSVSFDNPEAVRLYVSSHGKYFWKVEWDLNSFRYHRCTVSVAGYDFVFHKTSGLWEDRNDLADEEIAGWLNVLKGGLAADLTIRERLKHLYKVLNCERRQPGEIYLSTSPKCPKDAELAILPDMIDPGSAVSIEEYVRDNKFVDGWNQSPPYLFCEPPRKVKGQDDLWQCRAVVRGQEWGRNYSYPCW